jgi:hypothetical protein
MQSLPHSSRHRLTDAKLPPRVHPFPPTPKSIRVLTVLEEGDAQQTPKGSTGSRPGVSSVSRHFWRNSWQVAWAVVVGLFLAIAATSLFFWLRNHLGI